MAGVNVRAEEANRLGLTNASIAQQLSGAFSGSSVTTFWEGDRQWTSCFGLMPIRGAASTMFAMPTYSTLTGQRIPLRSVAELKPAWQITRIVRRNGIRTLTVGGFATRALRVRDPQGNRSEVKSIALPTGYRVEYGGEIYEQNITLARCWLRWESA